MKYCNLDRAYSYMIGAVLGFLEPLSVLLLWMLIFIIVDMASGCYASLKEGKHLQSKKLKRTIDKFLTYTTSIILLQGLDVYMMTFMDCGLAKIGCTLICGIEIYSVFENFYRATKNPVFKVLTQFVLKKMSNETNIELEEKEIKK